MKQIMNVVIEIESNCAHTVSNIEEALNFFWGSDGTFTVREAVERSVQRTAKPCVGCGSTLAEYHKAGCTLN